MNDASSSKRKEKKLDDRTLFEAADGGEHVIRELRALAKAFESVREVCLREKRHLHFHIASLVVELLFRRLDYALLGGRVASTRITYPSCVLVGWLRFLHTRFRNRAGRNAEAVPHGLCDPACNVNFHVAPQNKRYDTSYLMGAPYTCGPSEPPPVQNVAHHKDDVYELKYVYHASRQIMSGFRDVSHPALELMNGIVELLGARHACGAGYNADLVSFKIECARLYFYNAFDEYRGSGVLENRFETEQK